MHLTSNVVIGGLFLVSFLLVLVLDPKRGFVCLERGSCAESKRGISNYLLLQGAEPVLADTKPIRRKDCRSPTPR